MPSVYKKYKSTWDKNFYVRGEVIKPGDVIELTEEEVADLIVRKKSVVVDKKSGKTGIIRMIAPAEEKTTEVKK